MKNKSLTRREVIKTIAISGLTQSVAPYASIANAFANQVIRGNEKDVVLIGGGIMCATLATLLTQVWPDVKIEVYERQDDVATESSGAWNNAGTGHSALCELNYSPENPDGTVDIRKAFKVTEAFEVSKQFWSTLVSSGRFANPHEFINSTPHLSIVWGEKDAKYLKTRYETMSRSHLYRGMLYSEDPQQLADWMPVIMRGPNQTKKIAASRSDLGTDVNFGSLTHSLFDYVTKNHDVKLFTSSEVKNLHQDKAGVWHLDIKNRKTGETKNVKTRRVFIGAGGGALPLLEKSGIIEGHGYGGFPVGGQFFVCKNQALIDAHHVKVYGKASVGSPPMSVPHLDSRVIDGKRHLIFGPYAGFTTQFLKKGSFWDLPASVDRHNIASMLGAGADNLDLTKYLIQQVMMSPEEKLKSLQDFVPDAKLSDWDLIHAGQRVQVIKKGNDKHHWGVLEFGTEIVASKDQTLAALLGASPGASSSVTCMLEVLESCFKDGMRKEEWQKKLREIIPTYGQHLKDKMELTEKTRTWTHGTLELASNR